MDTPTPSPAVLAPAAPSTEPDPLLEPFRAELLRLLELPFSPHVAARALPKIKRTIEAAWLALGLRDPKRRAGRAMNVCTGADMGEWADPDDGPQMLGTSQIVPYSVGWSGNPSLNPSSFNAGSMQDRETFGATAIREIVGALKPPAQSVTELVKAIAEARAHGLDDVAAELMQQLRSSAATPPDPAALQATIGAAAKSVADHEYGPQPPPPLPEGVVASGVMEAG